MVGFAPGGDGNGWIISDSGARRWGRFGAAGLLLRAPSPEDPARPLVLMQHRAKWTASGDTWALCGGARDSHEDEATAALRETVEEAAIDPGEVNVRHTMVTASMTGVPWVRRGAITGRPKRLEDLPPLEQASDDEFEWTYTTVVADCRHPLETTANEESYELRWVPEDEVAELELMPAFAAAWAGLRSRPVRLVIDVANVLGSRPTGWWRDRRGATERLLVELSGQLPRTLVLPGGGYGWVSGAAAVVEGQARNVEYDGPLTLHRAPGEGDDTIVEVASGLVNGAGRAGAGGPGAGGPAGAGAETPLTAVVTADRGLRARLPGSTVAVGPSALLA